MSQNINLFNQQAAKVLAILWDNFPTPQIIAYSAFQANYSPAYLNSPESPDAKAIDKRRSILHDTLGFLSENDYIKYDAKSDIYLSNVRLTDKGVLILSKSHKTTVREEKNGDRISSAVKEGAEEAIAELITSLLYNGIK